MFIIINVSGTGFLIARHWCSRTLFWISLGQMACPASIGTDNASLCETFFKREHAPDSLLCEIERITYLNAEANTEKL